MYPNQIFVIFNQTLVESHNQVVNESIVSRNWRKMKLQIVLTVLFAFALCAESQHIDNSYIVQLKDGSTEAHIEEVIRKIEDHIMTSREEMEITSYSSALPLVFGKFGKETADMVSYCLHSDTDESDYRDFQDINEMEGYNSTNLEYSNM